MLHLLQCDRINANNLSNSYHGGLFCYPTIHFLIEKQEKMLQGGKVTYKSGHCSQIPRTLFINYMHTGFVCKYFSKRKTNTSMYRGRRELSLSFRHDEQSILATVAEKLGNESTPAVPWTNTGTVQEDIGRNRDKLATTWTSISFLRQHCNKNIQPSPAGVLFAYTGDKVGKGNKGITAPKMENPYLLSSSEQGIFSIM